MSESQTEPAGVLSDAIRGLFATLDRPAYWLLGLVYQLFFNVASADVFSNDTIMKFYGRMQLILGVFMLFQLTMTIIKGIANPDSFTDAKSGAGNIVSRIVVALLMLTILVPINIPNARNEYEAQINNNGLLFGTLYSLQHRLLENNTLGRLVLGTNDDDSNYVRASSKSDKLKQSARIFTSTILKGFYRINLLPDDQRTRHEEGKDDAIFNENRVCQSIAEPLLKAYTKLDANPSDIIGMVNLTCDSDAQAGFLDKVSEKIKKLTGNSKYMLAYMPFISTVVGFVFVFIMLSFTIDVAVRAVKLAVLRLIAPIPIISYMDPKGGKDQAFNSWVKTLTSTYLDLFIRLAAVYFVIFLIQDMIANGVVMSDTSGVLGTLSMIIIWIGLFIFAKQAPKFIKTVLGIKEDGGKLFGGITDALALGSAATGVIGSVRTGYRSAKEENAALHPGSKLNVGRNILSGITGGIGGGMAGAKAFAAKDASAKSVSQAYSQHNAQRAAHSTFGGRAASDIYGLVSGRSLATRDQAVLDANKAASGSIKNFKSTAVAEAMNKGSFGTVSAAKDRTGRLAGIEFNYRQLEAAISTKDSTGEFKYTDHNGRVHTLNAAWFDSTVMADIEDTQTANYLRSDYDVATGSFRNGKINTDWRTAKHDMSEAGIKYRGDYLGDISAGSVQNGGDYAYGDIGKSIGAANSKVADMSTDMRHIMNRANSQGKK